MIRMGVAGLGKMGISHLAIANTHPDVEVAAVCDTHGYVTDVLGKHTPTRCYARYEEMLSAEKLDAVILATPSKLHAPMVAAALQRGLHVFCEKPFVLDVNDGEHLIELADSAQLVTQVGYHFRFVAAFAEAARIVQAGALGTIHHARVEAYGPVVLRPNGSTWRSARSEGGGALYDYACHAIDLINLFMGPPSAVTGVVMNSIFSRDVEDEIYCSFGFPNGAAGQLAVNWSDESQRKMSTRVSLWGSNGRITADRQECQVYLRQASPAVPELTTGWNVRYTTELTDAVWFYLRGEEYSAQLEYFVQSIRTGRTNGQNTFRSALETDRVVRMIVQQPAAPNAGGPAKPRAGILARVRK
ncbi:MAG TPA: Gfo/Idh/MocA family oxidoreductase [Longimicrobiales bacterium]